MIEATEATAVPFKCFDIGVSWENEKVANPVDDGERSNIQIVAWKVAVIETCDDVVERCTPGRGVEENHGLVIVVVENPRSRKIDLVLQEFSAAEDAQRKFAFACQQIKRNGKMTVAAGRVASEAASGMPAIRANLEIEHSYVGNGAVVPG